MNQTNFPRRLDGRRQDSVARKQAREARSSRQQLAELDARLGIGVGARRERARLLVSKDRPATAVETDSQTDTPVQEKGKKLRSKDKRAQ